jgi:hypothetical protein
VQEAAINFYKLEEKIAEVLSDARKTEAVDVANIKLLLHGPRNREKAELFERQFKKWNLFIGIIRDYALVSRENTTWDNGI